MTAREAPLRIAVCQHPHGEGVWWDTDGHPHAGCIQDCDCAPKVYVAEAEEVERLREVGRSLIAAYMADDQQALLVAVELLEELTGGQQHGA